MTRQPKRATLRELHKLVSEALSLADELGLTEAGIALDHARLSIEQMRDQRARGASTLVCHEIGHT